ncbi:bifunctional diaminohydroxyphosphoribosylaminopyrimidine deaminase/5-amino-6-(5-phosphoribosylamino)uracil reductase RibD [Chelatococcus sp. GCM10030263]|uniref:bifunctional diaminohydroxyphosphoribosylaminopyrimidine deaminase/5-amino-6-(5-phosphoribosylamino)uracil reductase RibD n=1 Tax=Chelatococcus sp. GCM10030263 TaxID=3273387 RepID=UPI003618BE3B
MPSPVLSADPAADIRFMRDALALGARHLGLTWSNPSVGAIVTRNSPTGPVIVGRGMTQPGGRPHGEPVALAAAGDAARGATLYVALEPCSHWGRAGPCADAVIAAGIARVVSAIEDPDPRVAGGGHAKLRAAGIAVDTGVLAAEAARCHRGHVLRVRQGRPAVTLKLAATADGYAGLAGERLLITDPAANARVHLMRAHADAVMVGIGTVIADDPLLTVRLPGLAERSPIRIVIDTHLRTPLTARLVATARERPTWIIAGTAAPVGTERALVAAGVEVMRVATVDGQVDLAAALQLLGIRGLTRIFCEGGPRLADALAGAGLVDELITITSTRRLDDAAAPLGISAFGPHLAAALGNGTFTAVDSYLIAGDRFAHLERPALCSPAS